jgi:hypothetical protein
MILGDNFYDQTGQLTSEFFTRLSMDTKLKLFTSIPGNHDYWVCGTPKCLQQGADQQANGFMQWYGQDSAAASSHFPYDFSIDPDTEDVDETSRRPSADNFFVSHVMGNVGVIGFTGAADWPSQRGLFSRACDSMLDEHGVSTVLIMGHWDVPGEALMGAGLMPGMSVEAVHVRLQHVESCAALQEKGKKFKYVYGHTHCNRVMHEDTSYLVAGQGMNGCANYGFPVFDTTGGTFKVYHFLVAEKRDGAVIVDKFDEIHDCISEKGVTKRYDLAEEWTVVDL